MTWELAVVLILLALVALYLLMIMPRMFGKPDDSAFKTNLFAHRGVFNNKTEAPENSMPAFRRAVEEGFGIELDVQLTSDKVPVIFHDFTLMRACGEHGLLSSYSWDELKEFRLFESGEHIPRLDEFLAMVDGRVPLLVEIKSNRTDMEICRKTDALLSAYPGVYCIESFNPLVLFWYRRHRSKIMRGQLSDGFTKTPEYRVIVHRPFLLAMQFLLVNILSRPDFVAYNARYKDNLSRRLCRSLFRKRSAAWVVQSKEDLEKYRHHFDVFIFDGFIPEGFRFQTEELSEEAPEGRDRLNQLKTHTGDYKGGK